MQSVQQVCKNRVYVRRKNGRLKKLGTPRCAVFYPGTPKLAGYIIKRPDLLLMFKRKEVFCAADRLEAIEHGLEAIDAADTWDRAACRRLEIDYDQSLIWVGLPVVTEDGRSLGTISDVWFNESTYQVDRIDISNDSLARKLLGSADIPCSMIMGFKDGSLVVKAQVGNVAEAGGAAAAAGEAWARTKHSASQGAAKAGQAVDKGAYTVGKALGSVQSKVSRITSSKEDADSGDQALPAKQGASASSAAPGKVDKAANSVGRQLGRASRMFKDFKDEFDKASRDS